MARRTVPDSSEFPFTARRAIPDPSKFTLMARRAVSDSSDFLFTARGTGPFLNFLSYLLTLSWLGVPSLSSLCYLPILLWPQRPSVPGLLQPQGLPLGLYGSLSLLCGGLPLCHGVIPCHAGHLLCHWLQIPRDLPFKPGGPLLSWHSLSLFLFP